MLHAMIQLPLAIASLGIMAWAMPTVSYAIGIGPSSVILENLPQNIKIERTIFVLRGNPSKTEYASVELSGQAAPYITLLKEKEFPLPKGEEKTPIPIRIDTTNLGAGSYEATLSVRVAGESQIVKKIDGASGVTSSMSINQGVIANIRFTVTTEVIEDYSVNQVLIPATEDGQVLGIVYEIINNGTVAVHPGRIDLSIATSAQTKEIAHSESINGSRLPLVEPFTTKRSTVITGAALKTGKYRAAITIYNAKNEKLFSQEVSLEVFPEGSLAQLGEFTSFKAEKGQYKEGEQIKFDGMFKNTGTVGLPVSMEVNIFRDDERVETLATERTFVPKNIETGLSVLFTPQKAGSYVAKGVMNYGPFKTDEKVVYLIVEGLSLWIIIGSLGGIVVLLSALLFVAVRLKKKKRAQI